MMDLRGLDSSVLGDAAQAATQAGAPGASAPPEQPAPLPAEFAATQAPPLPA